MFSFYFSQCLLPTQGGMSSKLFEPAGVISLCSAWRWPISWYWSAEQSRSHPGQAFSALCSGLFWFSLSGTFVGEPGAIKAWIPVQELAFDTIPEAAAGPWGRGAAELPSCLRWDAAVGFLGEPAWAVCMRGCSLGNWKALGALGVF